MFQQSNTCGSGGRGGGESFATITHHKLKVTLHTSHVTRHTSHVTHFPLGLRVNWQMYLNHVPLLLLLLLLLMLMLMLLQPFTFLLKPLKLMKVCVVWRVTCDV